ncbi:MAG: Ig-like domain-containing protein, partial [Candidatus Subteraquimicrobiales bacterium]|nr:Ig-like domain-containing protein [Candidatus Subteraquimicrobiales bacterium]
WDTETNKIWTESFTITDTDAGEEITGVDITVTGATDLAGNIQESKTTENLFNIDTKNPTVPTNMTVAMNTPPAVDTISGSDGAVEANSTVKVYSTPELTDLIGSGLADENGSFGPINIGDNLHATVYVTATDAAGNQSSATSMLNDIAAPVTSDNVPSGWQTSDVTVTLTCDDSVGGNSGCLKVYYTTDGTTPTTASSFVNAASSWQFTISVDGNYTIKYRGEDAAGNLEAVKTAVNSLRLDKTAPAITNLTPSHTSVTSDTTPTISADFIESGSGIKIHSVIIKVDGVDQTDYATITAGGVTYTPIIALSAGTHYITVNAADMVGNSATQASWSFIVNPTVKSIAVSTDKTSVLADGTNFAKITAQVLDNGVPVQGATVNFA